MTSQEEPHALTFKYDIIPVTSHQVLERETIITAFAWDTSLDRDGPRMAITTNTGEIKLLRFCEDFTEFVILNSAEPLVQHEYEAWFSAFSPTGHCKFFYNLRHLLSSSQL